VLLVPDTHKVDKETMKTDKDYIQLESLYSNLFNEAKQVKKQETAKEIKPVFTIGDIDRTSVLGASTEPPQKFQIPTLSKHGDFTPTPEQKNRPYWSIRSKCGFKSPPKMFTVVMIRPEEGEYVDEHIKDNKNKSGIVIGYKILNINPTDRMIFVVVMIPKDQDNVVNKAIEMKLSSAHGGAFGTGGETRLLVSGDEMITADMDFVELFDDYSDLEEQDTTKEDEWGWYKSSSIAARSASEKLVDKEYISKNSKELDKIYKRLYNAQKAIIKLDDKLKLSLAEGEAYKASKGEYDPKILEKSREVHDLVKKINKTIIIKIRNLMSGFIKTENTAKDEEQGLEYSETMIIDKESDLDIAKFAPAREIFFWLGKMCKRHMKQFKAFGRQEKRAESFIGKVYDDIQKKIKIADNLEARKMNPLADYKGIIEYCERVLSNYAENRLPTKELKIVYDKIQKIWKEYTEKRKTKQFEIETKANTSKEAKDFLEAVSVIKQMDFDYRKVSEPYYITSTIRDEEAKRIGPPPPDPYTMETRLKRMADGLVEKITAAILMFYKLNAHGEVDNNLQVSNAKTEIVKLLKYYSQESKKLKSNLDAFGK